MRTLRGRWLFLALVLGLSMLPTACALGGGGTPTSTTAHTSKASTTTSTTAGAGGLTQPQQYRADMGKWVQTYWSNADTGALTFKKPLAPTAKEILRAKAFASAMHSSLDALRRIDAPAEAAAAHAQFNAALLAETRALDRLVRAIGSKNKRDIELAARDAGLARAVELQAQAVLGPYLGKAGSSTSTTSGSTTATTIGPTG